MRIRKYRWSRAYESAEEELLELLERKRIQAVRWAGEDGEEIIGKQYVVDTNLWCAEGLLTCSVGGKQYSLQPGDVLDLPAGSVCDLRVGLGGCATYESPAGSTINVLKDADV